MIFKRFLLILFIGYGFSQSFQSTHQTQLEYYNQHYAQEEYQANSSTVILGKSGRQRTPTKEIFGYHPYWMGTAWQNYNYNLLTTIAYFGAEATATGDLSDLHSWPVSGLINMAHANGVDVVLVVTLFNSSSLTTLLSSNTNRQNLINNLITQVQAGNADGVNIDFESMPSSQKQNMVTFITDLTAAFHSSIPGSQVTLAMPAVDWSDGWDYLALAQNSDGLFIMGYDYHYSGSSTTGANAPLTGGSYNVTNTINTYLNETGGLAEKIILGCPYFGFEWPATSGSPGASTTGTGSAKFYSAQEPLAQSYGKLLDTGSQTPWYRYQNPDWYQGWYDDSLSLSKKYDFALQNNLKGVGMWALGYDGTNPELWESLADKFGAESAPTVPTELAMTNIGNGSVMIEFGGAIGSDSVTILRGYSNASNVDTLGSYSQRPIVLTDLTIDEPYYLRIYGINSFGSSPTTEMLGIVPTAENVNVLVVNGFDRLNGTNNSHDFIRQHGSAIHSSGYAFESASNEAVIGGNISLNDYEIIDWILGEEGTATSTFTSTEQTFVADFLNNGGRLFVSGSEVGYDLSAQGSSDDVQFYNQYLKAQYISDAAGGGQGVYSGYGVNGSILDGINSITFDDGTQGTYDVDWPDGIKPLTGAAVCAKYSGVDYSSRGGMGVSYDGTFSISGSHGAIVYLSVGFEAIYPENSRNQIMSEILNYFEQIPTASTTTENNIPRAFGIESVFPNPSNSTINILLFFPQSHTNYTLSIIDLVGRTILTENILSTSSGKINWTWGGETKTGEPASSGVYLAVLSNGKKQSVYKFSLLK
ncbi:MAG: T9SS type A sorting domain-containing protein [Candidatus Marinimicrobia bacterium]|nr:T9SS type A sorting domain-containing protein [Candidatus Neomarinimicrobiota bacterium]MBT4281350.1 T9SS type A sorting domain-containing protein [Candidatus Neomarinimicrobiota bacterium]MBT6709694.1 T9SS type A sorting domain-containing protein [Candidatus Neomarinimicrobiota bacterium]MBT7112130.1 T9SS type A sorting domain-containing protein [Candidatus Neomarinimicrobiota bacterium]